MKKIFSIVALLAFAAAFASCEKDPVNKENPEDKAPVVTVTADAAFNAENQAQLTVKLSAAAKKDVKVTLAKAEPQSGKTKMDATFDKTVTIPAGETSKVVTVKADVRGLEAGEYQAAIKIASAEGAEVGTEATAYINFTYVFKPSVNLYADAAFASDATAKVKVVLAEATTSDVVVTLETGAESTATVDYEKTVTIPAGQTEKEVVVTVNVENIASGQYSAIINIASAGDNAVIGNAKSVSIALSYPFSYTITIDGNVEEWTDPGISTWTCPETTGWKVAKTLKMCADAKHLYIYLEIEDNGAESGTGAQQSSCFLDADGDPTTGGYVPGWPGVDLAYEDMGVEVYADLWMHLGTKADGVNCDYNTLYNYGNWFTYKTDIAPGLSVFGNLDTVGDRTIEDMYCVGSYKDGIGRLEIMISRKLFKITGSKVGFGIKFFGGGETATGALPQGEWTNAADPATRALCKMAYINLPPYQE